MRAHFPSVCTNAQSACTEYIEAQDQCAYARATMYVVYAHLVCTLLLRASITLGDDLFLRTLRADSAYLVSAGVKARIRVFILSPSLDEEESDPR